MDRFTHAAEAFTTLCRTMATLRAPGGCPWDHEQTLDSLKQYLIEETYETIDAIDSKQADAHREELGDLLLQIVFQAEITHEAGQFDIAEVAETINQKLIRRHPHVFGGKKADDAEGALRNWEQIKTTERSQKTSCLDGIPRAMPALLRALRSGEKAAAVGFDWPAINGVVEKVAEEWQELKETLKHESVADKEEEMGDLLFAITNLARHLKIDPENALSTAVAKFYRRFRYIEKQLGADKNILKNSSLDRLNQLWEEAKSHT